jgi:hypothetical protein
VCDPGSKEPSATIKEGLELNKEYRGVNKEVWQIFHRMYAGGPIIVREELDIYSRDLSKELGPNRNKEMPRKRGSSRVNSSSNSNIFAKAGGSGHGSNSPSNKAQQQRKKRNLFLSENIGLNDEDEGGIPEENLPEGHRLGNFAQRLQLNARSQYTSSHAKQPSAHNLNSSNNLDYGGA